MAQKRLKYSDLAQATSTDQLNSFIARNLRTVCQNRTESCSCCPSSPSLCSGPPTKKQKTRDDASTPSLSYVSWVCPTPPPQTPLPPPAATARRHSHLVQPQRPVQRRGLRHLPQRGAGQAGCGRALQPPFLRPAGPLGPLQLTSGTCRPPRTALH